MFETTGSLALIQPVFMLVGLIALPLVWTLLAAMFASPRSASPTTDLREGVIAPIVAITGSAGTLGLAIVIAVKLALMPRGYVFVQHVAELARFGQLDLALDIAVDPRARRSPSSIALVACASSSDVVVVAAGHRSAARVDRAPQHGRDALHRRRRLRPDPRRARPPLDRRVGSRARRDARRERDVARRQRLRADRPRLPVLVARRRVRARGLRRRRRAALRARRDGSSLGSARQGAARDDDRGGRARLCRRHRLPR